MSSIEKLLVLGIRGFSPTEASVIEFYAPLTLILGANGCGKTTIIECLKYATTGELPPNCKTGGGFVHDPKATGMTEVKGQVKLKFYDSAGRTLVCTRSLQATLKNANKATQTVQQKSLEGVIQCTDPKTGQRGSISRRCADLDTEIPLRLGVRRAVLDSVIFCHQEESGWPLSDPSTLKKRLDDILESTHYARALDELRITRKTLDTQLRTDQVYLNAKKERAAQAAALTTSLESARTRAYEATSKIALLAKDLEKNAAETTAVTARIVESQALRARIQVVTERRDVLLMQLADSANVVGEDLAGEPEMRALAEQSLKRELELTRSRAACAITAHEKASTKRVSLSASRDSLRSELNAVVRDRGMLEARVEQLASVVQNMNATAQSIASIASTDLQSKGVLDSETVESISKAFFAQFAEFKQAEKQKQDEIYARLQSTKTELQVCIHKREELVSNINENKERILTLKSKYNFDAVAKVAQEYEKEQRNLEQAREQFAMLQQSMQTDCLHQNCKHVSALGAMESEYNFAQSKVSEIMMSLTAVAQSSDAMAQLQVAEQTHLEQISKLHETNQLVNQKVSELSIQLDITDSFHLQLNNMIVKLESDFTLKKQKAIFFETQWRKAEASLVAARSSLEQAQKEAKKLEIEIAEITLESGTIDYQTEVKNTALMVEEANRELRAQEAMEFVLTSFCEHAQDNNACGLCGRSYKDQGELEATKNIVADAIHEIPESKVKLQQTLDNLNMKLARLRRAEPIAMMLERARERSNGVVARVVELTTTVEEAKKAAEKATLEEQGLREQVEKTKEAYSLAIVLNEHKHALLVSEKKIESLRHEIYAKKGQQNEIKSATELRKELEDLTAKCKTLSEKKEETQKECEKVRERVTNVQTKINLLRDRVCELQALQSATESSRAVSNELESKNVELALNVEQTDSKMTVLRGQIENIEHELFKARNFGSLQEEQLEKKIDRLRGLQAKYNALRREQEYLKQDCLDEKMQQQTEKARHLEKRLEEMDTMLQQIDEEVAKTGSARAELSALEHKIASLEAFKRQETEVARITADIGDLSAKLGLLKESECEEIRKILACQKDQLQFDKAKLQGEIGIIQANIEKGTRDLETEYKDAQGEYKEQILRVRTTELMIKDILLLARILDNAIMRYHSEKMDEINKIARELWSNTYTGGDIDYIELRSDNETGRGFRQYTYRLVMVRNGIEMEMRGRCSAGQKVLASIIIRLALAEVFCMQCGILALDEPTTNLDRQNIEGLAEALRKIIEFRKWQRNFQLIVITHDENFLQLLGRSEHADYFWRVFKTIDGYSAIERYPISADA